MATAQVEERQLLKAMSWWDGFVVALANPGFLIAALGFSIGALGTTGAFVLWTVSVVIGGFQNNVYAELATMFPNKPGGISLYAHEAWRKYLTLVGPLATFGYWFAWSSVLAINGLVVGTLVQAEWFSDSTWAESAANFDINLAVAIGIGAIFLVWALNVFGARPAVWFGYVTGALLILPAFVLMFLPYLTGDWSSDNMQWNIGANGGLALAMTWLYFMGWSSYGFETVAAFAPEYHSPETDTPRALRASAAFSVGVYALLPLGLGGTLGTEAVAADVTGISFYTQAFDILVGSAMANVMIGCLVAGLVLSMNTATMDGSRALFGIAREGMTVKQLGVLNKNSVPARAMTLDAVLNIFLITYFSAVIEILAAGNLGYMLAHVFALSGFLLLRKDRPNWPRPIRLSAIWVPIAWMLIAINLAFILFGGFIYADEYGYGLDKTLVGVGVLAISLALYVFRHVVQDRTSLRLREETPTMPEGEAEPAAATPA
ncbi:MAG: APC family permease [Solirubrobacterales bacterium]|nr:APC family permease [Solirubrobacterales bacterium]